MELSLGATLREITKVDKDSLTGVYWLNMEWVDENLAWYSGEWDQVFEKVIYMLFLVKFCR